MKKLLPYAIIGGLLVVMAVFVSGKLGTDLGFGIGQEKKVSGDTGPTPIPVSQVNLDNKTSVQSAIDAELNQLDKELGGINDTNLNQDSLSDNELGLD